MLRASADVTNSSADANSDAATAATDTDDSSSVANSDAATAVATGDSSSDGGRPNTPLAPWQLQGPPLWQRPAQGSDQGGGQAAAAAAAPRPSWSQRPSGSWPQRLQQGPEENDDGPCTLLPGATSPHLSPV